MKLTKSKKALYIYGPMLVIIVIIIMSAAFINLQEKYDQVGGKGEDKVIGVKQFTLLNTFQQGEKVLYYIDFAAKYSAEQSVYDLAENGGHFTSPCGAGGSTTIANGADPYQLWALYNKDGFPAKDCYPTKESLKNNFEKYFNYNINPYLAVYTDSSYFVSMPSEFSVDADDNLKVKGVSKDEVLVRPALNERSGGSWTGECGARIANIAETEFNKKVFEQPDGSNCGPIISQYTENNCEAWCADFVSWVYKTASYPFNRGSWRIAGADALRSYFEKNEVFIPKGTQDPIPGDVVFFRNSKCSGGVEHVGIVDSYKDNVLTTIEGNSGNRVAKNTYDMSSCILIGFGRLKECSQTSTATATQPSTPAEVPAGQPQLTSVKVTHYYTPLEKDQGSYGNGIKTFEENVKMQGSGIRTDGKILRYTGQILDPNKGQVGIRGITAIGTNPTAKRTIAVDTSVIPLKSTVYIDFGPKFSDWNGCYVAEDVGGAITNKHIDLYVGVGEQALKESSKLPQYASVWITKCTPMTHYDSGFVNTAAVSEQDTSNLKYTIPSSFKAALDYKIFEKYANYVNEAKLSLENFKKCIKKNELKDCEKNFKVVEVPDEAVYLKFDRSDDSFSPLYITKKPVVYKFALQLTDIVPPELTTGFLLSKIESLPGTSSLKVSFSWTKNPAEDLKEYKIYCSNTKIESTENLQHSATINKDKTEATIFNCGSSLFELGQKYYFVIIAVDKKGNELDKVVSRKNSVDVELVCCRSALSLLGLPAGSFFVANNDCGALTKVSSSQCIDFIAQNPLNTLQYYVKPNSFIFANAAPASSALSGYSAQSLQSDTLRLSAERNPAVPVDYLVLHHTAGASAADAINSWRLRGSASAHYIVDKDGTVISFVPEDRTAWHAGGSEGVPNINSRSIGIEIVNCGRGTVADGNCGQDSAPASVDPYPPAQVEAVRNLVHDIVGRYPAISEDHIVGHGYIASFKMACEPCGFPDYCVLDTFPGFEDSGWCVKVKTLA